MKQIAQALQDKLPRELRDDIYGFLWAPTLDKTKRALFDTSSSIASNLACPSITLPPFALPEFTGRSTADEALAYLYRKTFSEPQKHLRIRSVGTYLATDPLSRGFSPLSWIKFLHVQWDI
jgi:hypothetical protein